MPEAVPPALLIWHRKARGTAGVEARFDLGNPPDTAPLLGAAFQAGPLEELTGIPDVVLD